MRGPHPGSAAPASLSHTTGSCRTRKRDPTLEWPQPLELLSSRRATLVRRLERKAGSQSAVPELDPQDEEPRQRRLTTDPKVPLGWFCCAQATTERGGIGVYQ